MLKVIGCFYYTMCMNDLEPSIHLTIFASLWPITYCIYRPVRKHQLTFQVIFIHFVLALYLSKRRKKQVSVSSDKSFIKLNFAHNLFWISLQFVPALQVVRIHVWNDTSRGDYWDRCKFYNIDDSYIWFMCNCLGYWQH